MANALILGGNGMLGHAMLEEFQDFPGQVKFTSRGSSGIHFDVLQESVIELDKYIQKGDFILNCLGITKPHINDQLERDRAKAEKVNSLFPTELAKLAESKGALVIQIATDCVYSGLKGRYLETDPHDAEDVYGITKSHGEVVSPNVMHIRASTIGRELGRGTMLLEWVLSHPLGSTIPGYIDHRWNGVTTNHFARICKGIIMAGTFKPGLTHLVPANAMTKADLVREIAKAFGRNDLVIRDTESGNPTDRTLKTIDPEFNKKLWNLAGFQQLPTIEQLIAEIAS